MCKFYLYVMLSLKYILNPLLAHGSSYFGSKTAQLFYLLTTRSTYPYNFCMWALHTSVWRSGERARSHTIPKDWVRSVFFFALDCTSKYQQQLLHLCAAFYVCNLLKLNLQQMAMFDLAESYSFPTSFHSPPPLGSQSSRRCPFVHFNGSWANKRFLHFRFLSGIRHSTYLHDI